ncbi:helix-turn-helix domain-containing protein [Sphingobium sp. SCG-1]|uniref:helix-turn-helix domain-containing protein n=1 Tax=Sphingobium sp. SCG-1 TaxID=2072936 RepID=UPI0011AB66B4
MPAAVPLRKDYSAERLRILAGKSVDPTQVRRLITLARIYDGMSRSRAAKEGGVIVQTIREWVMRFNREGPDGLAGTKKPGPGPLLSHPHRRALEHILEGRYPRSQRGRVRLADIRLWLIEEFGIAVSRQTLSRECRALGYGKPPKSQTRTVESMPQGTFRGSSATRHVSHDRP